MMEVPCGNLYEEKMLIKKRQKGEKAAENFATDEYYTSEDALKQKRAHNE